VTSASGIRGVRPHEGCTRKRAVFSGARASGPLSRSGPEARAPVNTASRHGKISRNDPNHPRSPQCHAAPFPPSLCCWPQRCCSCPKAPPTSGTSSKSASNPTSASSCRPTRFSSPRACRSRSRGRPVDLLVIEDGKMLVAKNMKDLVFIDPATGKVIQTLALPAAAKGLAGAFSAVGLVAAGDPRVCNRLAGRGSHREAGCGW